jgi:rhodanese-related sulfurtransferase
MHRLARAFSSSSSSVKLVSKDTIKKLIEPGATQIVIDGLEFPASKIKLIDVRENSEVGQGIIPTATHIPLAKVSSIDFPSDSVLIFYCKSGARSELASQIGLQLGYKAVFSYKGSYTDWISE